MKLVRQLRQTSTGVKPIVAVDLGRREPTSDGGVGGIVTTADAAATARHQCLPAGSASPVPGSFPDVLLSLGRTTV